MSKELYVKQKEYQLIPAGVYPAQCVAVVDIGTQQTNFGLQEQIIFTFNTSEGQKSITRSKTISEKSFLRRDLKSWRGRDFTAEELQKFNIFSVLGAKCLINILHETVGEKTYANITGIFPLTKGTEIPHFDGKLIEFSLNDYTEEEINSLPEFYQKKIRASKEYQYGNKYNEPEEHNDSQEPDGDIPF